MKTRTLKQLYTYLLNSLREGDKSGYWNNGLCGEIDDLQHYAIISWEESCKLSEHLKKNKPTADNKFKKFYNNPLFIGGLWWWAKMKDSIDARNERIRFIEALIKTLR